MAKVDINGITFKVYDNLEYSQYFGYIYVTTNLVNGKRYVGLSYAKKVDESYLGSGRYLKDDIKKYGKNKFSKIIIDVANTKAELEELELYYIKEGFGVNVARDDNWYNIKEGRQSGGSGWAGYSYVDHKARVEKAYETRKRNGNLHLSEERIEEMRRATIDRFKDPKERLKTSQATKRAMNRADVVLRMRGRKHVVPQEVTDKLHESRRQLGLENIKNLKEYYKNNDVWNKGVTLSPSERYQIADRTRRIYKVSKEGKTWYFSVSNERDLCIALRLEKISGLGKNAIRKLAKGETSSLRGVSIESVDNSLGNKITVLPSMASEVIDDLISVGNVYRYSAVIDGESIQGYWKSYNEILDVFSDKIGYNISPSILNKLVSNTRENKKVIKNNHEIYKVKVEIL